MSATRDYLRLLDRVNQTRPNLFSLILDHGYTAPRLVPCPVRYRGEPKLCYNNSALTVLDNPCRYAYVEGFSTSCIPVEHAWVYDRWQDAFFDPTWYDHGDIPVEEYVGLMFRTPFLRQYIDRHKRAALVMADPRLAYMLANDPGTREQAFIQPRNAYRRRKAAVA
jgi:hypothetical protein